MVTGAVAVIIYGEPRLTHDLDLVLELNKQHIPQLIQIFKQEDFYCPPEEVLLVEAKRDQNGHFNLIHHATGFKADVYLAGTEFLHKWAMERRRSIEFEEEKIWVAPPEYVILRKMQYYREGGSDKHLKDIRSILEISADQVDRSTLEKLLNEKGLSDLWFEKFHDQIEK